MNAPKKRSPFAIVRRLIVLVRSMLPVMLAAIAMGVAGYFCATFIFKYCRYRCRLIGFIVIPRRTVKSSPDVNFLITLDNHIIREH